MSSPCPSCGKAITRLHPMAESSAILGTTSHLQISQHSDRGIAATCPHCGASKEWEKSEHQTEGAPAKYQVKR